MRDRQRHQERDKYTNMRQLQYGVSVVPFPLYGTNTLIAPLPRNRCMFLLLVSLQLLPILHALQSSTAAFNATKRNITRYPDINNKRNPYDEGCLYSYGLQDVRRTCNSEDTDTTKCSNNDLNYMEIRIHTGDWESITYESWIIQILLSEILHVPTTIDSGFGNEESLNFYNSRGEYSYGRYTLYGSLSTAYNSKDGDCVPIIQGQKLHNPNVTCAHVIPESWRGTQSSSEIREMVFENILEPPQTLGVLGLETWFITKFTLEENPQFAIYLGLQGEENRQLVAKTFKRPTTWYDYCTLVSTNNCSVPDNVTQRPPTWNTDEVLQYYNEGNYIGHFQYTEDNDCDLHPTTCTGHIADFPCDWDSFVQSQIKYLNIPLKSSGPEEPIGGYTYSRLVELWKAANATKSNLIMHYWTPEPLVQEFVDSDAEFIRITMPPPSQLCADSRRPEKYQCSLNDTLRYGVEEGVCEESAKNLYKLVVGNLYDVIHDDRIPDPIRSPAYDALRLFQLSELQLGQIFDYLHKSSALPYYFMNDEFINTTLNDTTITSDRKTTARDAVCHWVIENLDILHTFVPRTYPRTIYSATSDSGPSTSNSSNSIFKSDSNAFSIVTIILGCTATTLVAITWYMVYKHKTLRSIRFAQIEFLYLLLGGLLLVAIGSILVGLHPTNATCITVIWFINFGYTLEFVPLIVKVAAVNKLIGSARRFRRVVLSRRSLFSAVIAISAIVFIFLLVWTIFDPPTKNKEYVLTSMVNDNGNTIVDVSHFCSSESAMWDYIAVGWNTLLLLCATVLAFQTRTLQKDFNESQTLAFLIYSHFIFVVLRLITVILQQWSGTTSSVEKLIGLRSFLFSMDTIATILIYFVPKFTAAANKNDSDRLSSSTTINNNELSSSLRNGNASSHLREDQLMGGSSESSRNVIFESLHSITSTDTMKQSNRYNHQRLRDVKKYNGRESSQEPISDSNFSGESCQSEEHRRTSQIVDDQDESVVAIVAIGPLDITTTANNDKQQDLSSSSTTTTTATADEVTKYTTILVGNIDERFVDDGVENR